MKYKLKVGAPPDDQLLVRVTVRHTYKPNLTYYNDWPEEGLSKPTSMVEAMTYDKMAIGKQHTSIIELIESGEAEFETIWELVDIKGNVWSEPVEEVVAKDKFGYHSWSPEERAEYDRMYDR